MTTDTDGIPLEVVSVTLWHSTNGGRTWNRIQISTRSPLAAVWFNPDDIYDDGYGNLYRSTPPDQP
jgi:photosystem II stability/assembly factor-like uncharacterized protein